MQLSEWSILLLLLKLASYVAISGLAGTLLMRLIASNSQMHEPYAVNFFQYLKRWQLGCVLVGSLAAIVQVPIEAGAVAESGFKGILDPLMLEIIWQSVIGEQARLRIPAFIVALFAISGWDVQTKGYKSGAITLVMLGLIAYSFTFLGHSAHENTLVKVVLTFHLIAIASWLGSLWPLYKSCSLLIISDVKRLMHDFGQFAIVMVSVLVISGLTLLLQYLTSFAALFTSNYGQLALLKLFLVSAMLALGAWHKLYLVPQLSQSQHLNTLKSSITVEMLLALGVIITTSVFTTLVGPPSPY